MFMKIISGMNITESRLPQDGSIEGIIEDIELGTTNIFRTMEMPEEEETEEGTTEENESTTDTSASESSTEE